MNRIRGAINRYRANDCIRSLTKLGFEIVAEERETRPDLPVARQRLVAPFKQVDTIELEATVGIVARQRVPR